MMLQCNPTLDNEQSMPASAGCKNNKNEGNENPEADSPDIPSYVLPLVSP